MSGTDDRSLVKACLDGDPEAFELLVDRHGRVLYNTALRMVGDPEDARDITQTAFVKAWEKLDTYDPRFKFFSWIYRITLNESLNWIKRRRPQEEPSPNLPARGPAPDDGVHADQTSALIQAALNCLSADYRAVIVLRHFQDLSYSDMSVLLDIPEKTVKSRLFTARRQLCDLLRKEGLTGLGLTA